MDTRTLILPGLGDSDSGHWQSLWQSAHPNFVRVQQRDWEYPVCTEWADTLEKAVVNENENEDGNIVLVAHSLGCLLVAHWASQTNQKIKGALLVAPPCPTATPSAIIFDTIATGFLPVPMQPFNFPSIVVASSDDTYSDLDFTQSCAESWGSGFVNIGAFGHINTSSGLGAWNEGFSLYQKLVN